MVGLNTCPAFIFLPPGQGGLEDLSETNSRLCMVTELEPKKSGWGVFVRAVNWCGCFGLT